MVAILLILPSMFGSPRQSEIPEKEDLVDNMPTLENVSSFISAIPSIIRSVDFNVQKNLTMELVVRTGNVDILYEKTQPWLKYAVLEFYSVNGINISNLEIQNFFNEIDLLPPELRQAIAFILYSLNNATLLCRDATKNLTEEEIDFLRTDNETQSDLLSIIKNTIKEKIGIFPNLDLFYSESDKLSFILQKIDTEKMVEGSLTLLESIRYAVPAIEKYGDMYADGIVLKDPSGMIIVGGNGTNVYDGKYSLILDLGGNDVYDTKNIDGEAALVVDVAGNDRYRGKIANSFLGISMLLDLSGNDFYTSGDWSQSYACAGISFMLDFDGDDIYAGGNYSQGSANAGGISILADMDGNDTYSTKDCSQAFANGNGFSLLVDVSGNDMYNAVHHSQGSATSGGMAILLDFLGDDKYVSKKNSQGAGEGWADGLKRSSIGSLIDFSGNDMYKTDEFSQGFGQTVGVGVIADFLGNDRYISKNSSQACSKFFGIALLADMHGNNTYESKYLSGEHESTGGISLLIDGITSTFNEKLWELLRYISQNNIIPISSFIGI